MPGIGMQELVFICVIGLIIFGPGKLPELGRALGKAIREFRKVSNGIMDDIDEPVKKHESPVNMNKADKLAMQGDMVESNGMVSEKTEMDSSNSQEDK